MGRGPSVGRPEGRRPGAQAANPSRASRLRAAPRVAGRTDSRYIEEPARVSAGRGARRMLNEIYNKRILELAADIPRLGRLERPDASATAHSKLCGSTVTVDLALDGDVVRDFAHDVKACALGQASSSIMARHVVGSTAEELRTIRNAMRKMLKEGGDAPSGRWEDL